MEGEGRSGTGSRSVERGGPSGPGVPGLSVVGGSRSSATGPAGGGDPGPVPGPCPGATWVASGDVSSSRRPGIGAVPEPTSSAAAPSSGRSRPTTTVASAGSPCDGSAGLPGENRSANAGAVVRSGGPGSRVGSASDTSAPAAGPDPGGPASAGPSLGGSSASGRSGWRRPVPGVGSVGRSTQAPSCGPPDGRRAQPIEVGALPRQPSTTWEVPYRRPPRRV
jgi:hypothetical protein